MLNTFEVRLKKNVWSTEGCLEIYIVGYLGNFYIKVFGCFCGWYGVLD